MVPFLFDIVLALLFGILVALYEWAASTERGHSRKKQTSCHRSIVTLFLVFSATMSIWRTTTRLPSIVAVVFFCCKANAFRKLVLSIFGTMVKPIFVVASYIVVGLALPMTLALFFLSGLGRFLHHVIMQPKRCDSGNRALRKVFKKVSRRLDKKRRKALRPFRRSLGKHFLFWLRCAKICIQCVPWILFLAKLYLCHCALLLLAALIRMVCSMAMAYLLVLLIARVYFRIILRRP